MDFQHEEYFLIRLDEECGSCCDNESVYAVPDWLKSPYDVEDRICESCFIDLYLTEEEEIERTQTLVNINRRKEQAK